MTPAGERLLRLALAEPARTAPLRRIREIVLSVLELEGCPPPDDPPTDENEVHPSTLRWRKWRAKQGGAPTPNGGDPTHLKRVGKRTSNAFANALANAPQTRLQTRLPTLTAPPRPPEIPEIPEEIPSFIEDLKSERGSETRVREPLANADQTFEGVGSNANQTLANAPSNAPQTRHTNATRDGVYGMAVSAWAEGVQSVTGKTFISPSGGSAEMHKLIAAILACCPDAEKRIDWARAQGAAFAKTNKGKLSAHSFVDWLNSPPPSATKAGPPDEPNRYSSPAVIEARREREHANRMADQTIKANGGKLPADAAAYLERIGVRKAVPK